MDARSTDRLAEEGIPLGARIFAVVDSLDAMTDCTPYPCPSAGRQRGGGRRCRGSQFDPDIVDGFEACEADLHRLYTESSPRPDPRRWGYAWPQCSSRGGGAPTRARPRRAQVRHVVRGPDRSLGYDENAVAMSKKLSARL